MMKKLVCASCAFLLLLALGPSGLDSQEGRGQGRLSGVVVDEEGNLLEGVKVTLRYEEFTNTMDTVSNAQGQFRFIGLGRGTITLILEKEGFVQLAVPMQISGLRSNPQPKITLKKPAGGEAPVLSDAARETLVQANTLYDQGQFKTAETLYRDLVDQNPALYQIRLNLANTLMELQDYERAEDEYRKVLEGLNAEPEDKRDGKSIAQVYASIGETYLSRNKLQEAEEHFIKSLEINPSDPALPFNVAEILMQSGDADKAIRYYDMALGIKPDWPKAYLKLGYAWLNKGDNAKAVDCFKKVIAAAPADDPDAELARDILKALSAIK